MAGAGMNDPQLPEQYWRTRSESFDTVAELYDAYRPTYPAELIDSILCVTKIPSTGQILEIGSGTGKATQLFAEKGFRVHCIEPGENLLQVARRKLQNYPQVSYAQVRFEDWSEDKERFDLIISAQAFHWIDPRVGYQKAAQALKPNGHMALFWNMYCGYKGDLEPVIDKIYQERAPVIAQPAIESEALNRKREAEIQASGSFSLINVQRFNWFARYDCQEYIGLLNTYSDHISLPEPTRSSLFDGIAEVIQQNGGAIDKLYQTILFVAQKLA